MGQNDSKTCDFLPLFWKSCPLLVSVTPLSSGSLLTALTSHLSSFAGLSTSIHSFSTGSRKLCTPFSSLFPCYTLCLSKGIHSHSIQLLIKASYESWYIPTILVGCPEREQLSREKCCTQPLAVPFMGGTWMAAHAGSGFNLLASPAQEGLASGCRMERCFALIALFLVFRVLVNRTLKDQKHHS